MKMIYISFFIVFLTLSISCSTMHTLEDLTGFRKLNSISLKIGVYSMTTYPSSVPIGTLFVKKLNQYKNVKAKIVNSINQKGYDYILDGRLGIGEIDQSFNYYYTHLIFHRNWNKKMVNYGMNINIYQNGRYIDNKEYSDKVIAAKSTVCSLFWMYLPIVITNGEIWDADQFYKDIDRLTKHFIYDIRTMKRSVK